MNYQRSQAFQSPYQGLKPYTEKEAPFFFGREKDREIISDSLRGSQLSLLIGESGVGKSSVLHAGVVHTLRQRINHDLRHKDIPRSVVVFLDTWRNPAESLVESTRTAIAESLEGEILESPLPGSTMSQVIKQWVTRLGGNLFIVLDQFEDFLCSEPQCGQGIFMADISRLIRDPTAATNVLISIREDKSALLHPFTRYIPNLYHNILRLYRLDLRGGREAIEKPIEEYNRRQLSDNDKIIIEPALVDAIIEEVAIGVAAAENGSQGGDAHGRAAKGGVETAILQLVMSRLWAEEIRLGSRELRLKTLKRLGGAKQIVYSHLESALLRLSPEQQKAADDIFYYLVTPRGEKVVHSLEDLVSYTGLRLEQLEGVLQELAGKDSRIVRELRPNPDQFENARYEIFHDILAAAILEWRRRRRKEPTHRTRGRNRALKIETEAMVAHLSSFPLYRVLDELRTHADGLPLTIVVHGWGTGAAASFVKALPAGPHHALWLIKALQATYDCASSPREGAVVLDPESDKGRRIHHNLMADLAFFAAAEPHEIELAKALTGRALAVAVEPAGLVTDAVTEAFAGRSTTVLLRTAVDRLELAGRRPSEVAAKLDLQEMGRALTEEVRILEDRRDRRHHLRAAFANAMATHPHHAKWREDLIRLAHDQRWPAWAVQCLPALYVPLESEDSDRPRALVWRYIGDCVSEDLKIEKELCGGQFQILTMTLEVADLVEEIAKIFLAQLVASPFNSDRAFLTVVTHTLSELELHFEDLKPDVARRLRGIRLKMLKEGRVFHTPTTQRGPE